MLTTVTRWNPRSLALLLAVLAAAACAVDENGQIHCQDDTNCPPQYPACSTAGVCVSGAPASTISISSGSGQTGTAGTALALPLAVLVSDAQGNPSPGVSVSWAAVSGGGSVVSATSITGAEGTASTVAKLGDAVGVNTFTATAAGLTGSPVTFSATSIPASATQLVLSGPTSAAAGSSLAFTLTAQDAHGNVAPGYRGTVSFSSSDASATLPSAYTFGTSDSGTHAFQLTLRTAGAQAVTASDGTLTSAAAGVTVAPLSAVLLSVSGFSSPATAGVEGSATVIARDQFGNVATDYLGTVHLSTSNASATLAPDYTFTAGDAGEHALSATLNRADASSSLIATDTATASITGSETGIVVNPGAAATLSVSGFDNPTTASKLASALVTALDGQGNVATGYRGTVHLSTNNPSSVPPADYAYLASDAGAHPFTFALVTASAVATYSITAADTATASITGSQSGIVVNPAVASSLIVSGLPASITAGASVSVTVMAQDPASNVAVAYRGTIHFTASAANAGDSLPADYTFVSGDNGAHTFNNVVLAGASATASLTASDASAAISGSQTITVNPASTSKLALTEFPASVIAGSTNPLTVTAQDQFGNTTPAYRGSIHVTTSPTNGGNVLPGGYTFVSGDNGAHAFAGVVLAGAGTVAMTATDDSNGSIHGSESGITVTAASTSTLTVTGFPASVVAGSSNSFTVTARDAFGNTTPAYRGSIHVTASPVNAGNMLPADYTFVGGDNGTHAFTDVVLAGASAGGAMIAATDVATASISGSESGITVTASSTTTLSITGFPTSVAAGSGNGLTVTAQDPFGNTTTGYRGRIHFTASPANAGNNLPGDYTFSAGDSGARAFSNVLLAGASAGGASITATDTSSGSITGSESGITVTPAATIRLAVTGFPSSVTAGSSNGLNVTALDQFGNTTPAYVGSIHFTASPLNGSNSLPADYTFVSGDGGAHAFTGVVLAGASAGGASITATDKATGSIMGSESSITVLAGATSALVVSGFPASVGAGTNHTLSVAAQDQFGNPTIGYLGQIHFTASPANPGTSLPADYTFVAGDHGAHMFSSVALAGASAGGASIVATDTANASITGEQSGITVSAATTALLSVTGFPASVAAGSSNSLTVTAEDQYGNTTPAYRGSIHVTATPGNPNNSLPADYTFVSGDNGAHMFTGVVLSGASAGGASITATDKATGSITGSESSITVLVGSTSALVVSGFPTSASACATSALTVTAQDRFGNSTPAYSGTVHFTASLTNGGNVLPADYTFVGNDNGMHTFTGVALAGLGSGQSITATDLGNGAINGAEGGISVSAGGAFRLAVSGFPSSVIAGSSNPVTVTAQDQCGNTSTGYTGQIHFTAIPSGANTLPPDYTFTSGNMTKDNGVHQFNNVTLVGISAAGGASITATDKSAASITGTESGITVTPAAAKTLSVVYPTAIIQGMGGTLVVTALDPFGNIATGYTGAIHITSNDSTAQLPADYTFVSGDAGVHSFFNQTYLLKVQTTNITATDKATGSINGQQSGIVVSVGPLVFGGAAATISGGVRDGLVFIAGGNTAENFSGTDQAQTFIYNPATGALAAGPNMVRARSQHAAVALPGTGMVVIAGGKTGHSEFELCDLSIATPTCKEVSDQDDDRCNAAAVAVSSTRVLIAGGDSCANTSPRHSWDLWDSTVPGSHVSSSASNQQTQQRRLQTATSLGGGKVLLAGGSGGADADVFTDGSPPTMAATAGGMLISRSRHSASTVATTSALATCTGSAATSFVLLAGGETGTADKTWEVYDPASNTFPCNATNAGNHDLVVPGRAGQAAAVFANGKLVLGGGNNGTTDLSSTEFFDPNVTPLQWSNQWPIVGVLPLQRTRYEAASAYSSAQNQLIFIGGSTAAPVIETLQSP